MMVAVADPIEILHKQCGLTKLQAQFVVDNLHAHGWSLVHPPQVVENGDEIKVEGNGFSIVHDVNLTPDADRREIIDAMCKQYAVTLMERLAEAAKTETLEHAGDLH